MGCHWECFFKWVGGNLCIHPTDFGSALINLLKHFAFVSNDFPRWQYAFFLIIRRFSVTFALGFLFALFGFNFTKLSRGTVILKILFRELNLPSSFLVKLLGILKIHSFPSLKLLESFDLVFSQFANTFSLNSLGFHVFFILLKLLDG